MCEQYPAPISRASCATLAAACLPLTLLLRWLCRSTTSGARSTASTPLRLPSRVSAKGCGSQNPLLAQPKVVKSLRQATASCQEYGEDENRSDEANPY